MHGSDLSLIIASGKSTCVLEPSLIVLVQEPPYTTEIQTRLETGSVWFALAAGQK